MTRFQKLLIVALLLAVAALAFGRLIAFVTIIAVTLVIIGLGVAFPRLRFFGSYVCHGNQSPSPCSRGTNGIEPAESKGWVALTFDDGPDGRSTPALLDLLLAERVAAAFFCVGQRVASEPALAARIVREGHLLENHSFAHSNFTNFFSLARFKSELERTQAAIQAATGVIPRFFRPPMGLSNPRTFRAAQALGLTVIGWSARGLDTITTDPERVVARILRRVKPGAIILLHDGNIPAERLVLTVKVLLARLREREYEIVRLDQMLK
jgi:peptidoglycan/xylan/chitin deacetylase (PgdA/CDA1 family)